MSFYVHGNLNVPIYVSQPRGFKDIQYLGHVFLLRCSLYGLRQASRAWYDSLCTVLESFGMIRSKANSSLFTYHHGVDCMYVLAYVDDLVLTGSSSALLDVITSHLKSHFAVKDLGSLSYFLGTKVANCKEGLILSQHKYVVDLLHRHKMDGVKPFTTAIDLMKYHSAIDNLQYLTIARPDIAFTVKRLSQSIADPSTEACHSVKRLFCYLKGSLHHGLVLRCTDKLILTTYSDSNLSGDLSDCKATSAYIIFLGSTPISWRSYKQRGVARSSTKMEIVPLPRLLRKYVGCNTYLMICS